MDPDPENDMNREVIGERQIKTDIAAIPTKEDLIDALQCPVCLEVLCGKIMLCVKGHSFCEYCAQRVTNCPICRADITGYRCLALEHLISSMTFKCRYENSGCLESFSAEKLQPHLWVCDWRDYVCQENFGKNICNSRIPLSLYKDHLSNIHDMTPVPDVVNNAIVINQIITFPAVQVNSAIRNFERDGKLFFVKYGVENSHTYCRIIIVADVKTARTYKASLIFNKDVPSGLSEISEGHIFEVPVSSFREPSTENLIRVPLNLFVHRTGDGNQKCAWTVTISIQNIIGS